MIWYNFKNWIRAAENTFWCLLGCSIGDFGTIFIFQLHVPNASPIGVMILAIFMGLATSIWLETFMLKVRSKFPLAKAIKTAIGMSFISMVGMELAMNVTDFVMTGGAVLTWSVIPIMLLVGFLAPLPYNYWRLEKHGKCCH